MTLSAKEALEKLRSGNGRFVANHPEYHTHAGTTARTELAAGQSPFAVILGCSDSRVPVELVFDQGLGDLFVIRVAGNIVGRAIMGSIEYATAQLGARLVVVLGHSQCGAVSMTVKESDNPTEGLSPNLASIVERMQPALQACAHDEASDCDRRVEGVVRTNVRNSAQHLRQGSDLMKEEISERGLRVVGASYSLTTGLVEFFDGLPME